MYWQASSLEACASGPLPILLKRPRDWGVYLFSMGHAMGLFGGWLSGGPARGHVGLFHESVLNQQVVEFGALQFSVYLVEALGWDLVCLVRDNFAVVQSTVAGKASAGQLEAECRLQLANAW